MEASDIFRERAYDMTVEYGYIDEPQPALLRTLIDGTIMQLTGSGVPVQEENAEYLMAVVVLTAYRYNRRTTIATNMGANDKDEAYAYMLRSSVWRLRSRAQGAES